MSLVGADATVSTVGAASHHGGVVHLDVRQLQVLHSQTLRLAVGLEVVQQHEEVSASSLGPSALVAGSLDGVTLGVTTHTAVVACKGDRLLVGDNVVEIALSLHQGHALDGTTHFASVLEVDSEVRTTSLAAYAITTTRQPLTLLRIDRGSATRLLAKSIQTGEKARHFKHIALHIPVLHHSI